MGVRKDLKRAKRRTDLASRTRADVTRDASGVVLVEGEFTETNGLLTPSLKVKRHAVTARYAQEIEDLYRK